MINVVLFMHSKYIPIIILVLLLSQISVAHEDQAAVTIHIDESGFHPAKVSIGKGEMIVFENNGTLPHWPASDFHPTHTNYPQSSISKCNSIEANKIFDSCRAIEPGELYFFKFKNIGMWGAHDHFFPKFRIMIGVEENQKDRFFIKINFIKKYFLDLFSREDQTTYGVPLNRDLKLHQTLSNDINKCYNSKNYLICIENTANARAPKYTYNEIITALKNNANHSINCHDYLQFLTRRKFQEMRDVGEFYSICDSTCGNACYHGVAEGYLKTPYHDITNLDFDDATNKLLSACSKTADENPVGLRTQCVHGIGHGLMLITDWDLLESLDYCDLYPNRKERSDCYSGVFMEFFLSFSKYPLADRLLNNSDKLYPCSILEEKYTYTCIGYLTEDRYIQSNKSFSETSKICELLDDELKNVCFRQLGHLQSRTFRLGDINRICDNAVDQESRQNCHTGFVRGLTEYPNTNTARGSAEQSDLNYRVYRTAVHYCSALEPKYREKCYKKIGTQMKSYGQTSELVSSICLLINETSFIDVCLNPKNH